MREGGSNDQAAKRVPDEADAAEARQGAELLDVLLDLVCQPLAHVEDVSLGEVLVDARGEEDSLGVAQREVVLEDAHIARVPLEAVAQHEQMNSTIVHRL